MLLSQNLIHTPNKPKATFASDRASDHPKRSIAKSISWRILGTLDTVLIAWVVTGTLSVAFSIGLIEWITKMVLYFVHERIWNSISWGK